MKYHLENFSGEYDFRCRRHIDEFVVELHLHEYSEILYSFDGTADIIVDKHHIELRPKEIIFIPPNVPHEYLCKNCDLMCAVFSNDFIPAFHKQIIGLKTMCMPFFAPTLNEIIEDFETIKDQNIVTICGYLNIICGKVMDNICSTESKQNIESALYPKIISYLSEHYQENITLKAVAKKFGYNEKYLSSTLHQISGMNFRHLISLYRVNKAKELMRGNINNMTIAEIAITSGFTSIASFNRIFKEFTGNTPKNYISVNNEVQSR